MREFDLLNYIAGKGSRLDGRIILGPGDDMAVCQATGGPALLLGVDQVIAGRHFDPQVTPLPLVGRKAMTRSLSDVAAMAGRPSASLASVALPPNMREADAQTLFDAMAAIAEQFDCPLIGGDTAVHSAADYPLTCSVTVLAEAVEPGPVLRSGAKPGDGVYVTGALGGAMEIDPDHEQPRHLTFTPRIPEALQLLELLGEQLHALIDISDGLGRDAGHVARRSHVRLELDARAIPTLGGDTVAGGEDYELLFTTPGTPGNPGTPRTPPAMLNDAVPVTRIGEVHALEPGETPLVMLNDGSHRVDISALGWEHGS